MKRGAFDAFRGCFGSTGNSTFVRTLPMLLGLAMPAFAPAAHAATTATDNLAVSASVAQKCTVVATGVTFSAYDPVVNNASSALTATGSLAVKCTKGSTAIAIALGNGTHYGTTRNLSNGTDSLSYELYQPADGTDNAACAYTTAWNSTNKLTPSVTWSAGTARTFNVCGSIPGGQDVSAGSGYTDTVVATVEF